eukprot:9483581-Pyramimonas_sp.AAC.1
MLLHCVALQTLHLLRDNFFDGAPARSIVRPQRHCVVHGLPLPLVGHARNVSASLPRARQGSCVPPATAFAALGLLLQVVPLLEAIFGLWRWSSLSFGAPPPDPAIGALGGD